MSALYLPTVDDLKVLKLKNKSVYVKIELLDHNYLTLAELNGVTIDLSLSINANSDIRRTLSLTMTVRDDSLLLGESRKIWFDRYIRVYAGYLNTLSPKQEVLWYNMGIYLFNQTSYSYDVSTKNLSLSCSDLMSELTGARNGAIPAIMMQISEGANIREVMIKALTQDYNSEGEGSVLLNRPYIIDDIGGEINVPSGSSDPRCVPYDLKFNAGATRHQVIEKLRDLYPGWETYFDVNGVFICKRIPTCKDDAVALTDSVLSELVISEQLQNSLEEVKNDILLYGVQKKDNTQIEARCWDQNEASPFCVQKLGRITEVLSGGEYAKIATNDLALQRAKYELWKRTRLNDGLQLQTITIPWLDVNQKIRYTPRITGKTEEWIIKSINHSVSSGTSSLELIKFYPLYPDIT